MVSVFAVNRLIIGHLLSGVEYNFSGVSVCMSVCMYYNKMLSYRRETALQGALQFSPKVEDWNWETVFYVHFLMESK